MTKINTPRFSSVFRLVRGSNWWYSKIPPLLSIAYAVLLLQTPPPGRAVIAVGGTLICLCSLAAYGHIVNDAFDLEEDRRAGKPNAMVQRTVWQRISLCILFAVLGFVPWLWVDFGLAAAMVLVANYLLPMAYSIPPLRLKERGVWGVVADAAGVHAVPTLFVATAVSNLGSTPEEASLLLIIVATAWSFFAGLRGIVVHQLWDRENDTKAGATTLVTSGKPDRVRRFVRRLVFPAEVLALGGLTLVVFPVAPLVLYSVIGCAIFDAVRLKTWQMPFDPAPASPRTYIPPADFYEVWLPLALIVTLVVQDPLFLLLAALHLVLFFRDVKMRIREVVAVLSELTKRFFKSVRSGPIRDRRE